MLSTFVLLRIDSSSIPAYQVSVRPIRLQQIFLSMLFKVEGQVVNWPTSTFPIGRGVCSRCRISTLQLTLVGAASTLGHALRVGEQQKMVAHTGAPAVQWGSYLFPLLWIPWVAGVMKPSTPLPALATSRDSVLVFPHQGVYDTSSAIGHLAMERERHTVYPPPASLSCQRGRTDLTDLVTSYLFIYIFVFIIYIFVFVVFMLIAERRER